MTRTPAYARTLAVALVVLSALIGALPVPAARAAPPSAAAVPAAPGGGLLFTGGTAGATLRALLDDPAVTFTPKSLDFGL